MATLLGHVDNRVQRFVGLVLRCWPGASRGAPNCLRPARTRRRARNCASDSRRREPRSSRHISRRSRGCSRASCSAEAWVAGKEAAATLVTNGQESPVTELEHCDTLPGEIADDAPAWLALATLLLTESGGTPRKTFDYKIGFPAGPESKARKARARELTLALEDTPDLVQQLHAVRQLPEPHYTDDEWRVLEAQLIVLRLAAAELEVVFAERRAADYPRFASAALESLGDEGMPTDTALALDATLSHVLVDEFQDTSETQVRLLRGLTAGWQRGDGRTLFLVGDPMQSIYRFRNAEVGLFLDVRENGIGDLQLRAVDARGQFPLD